MAAHYIDEVKSYKLSITDHLILIDSCITLVPALVRRPTPGDVDPTDVKSSVGGLRRLDERGRCTG